MLLHSTATTPSSKIFMWAFRIIVVVTLAFMMAPVISVIWVSFFEEKIISFPPSSYTLKWYSIAWAHDNFRNGLYMSLVLGFVSAIGSLIVGIPAGYVLGRSSFKGRDTVKIMLLLPMMVPSIVAGGALFIFFIQAEIATEIQFAGTFLGLSLAHITLALPWSARLITAAMIDFDDSLDDAARGLGASPWTFVRRILLPIVRPAVIGAALFSFIASFVDLEKSLFLIGPGRTTLPIAVVNHLEWSLDPSIAAISTIQIAIVVISIVIASRYVSLARSF
jgi:putative spermidine/putrescine transport system permease protein